MKYLPEDNTIVALSSPLGNGAIAVIRVSGNECLEVMNPLLKRKTSAEDARKAIFNEIIDPESGSSIDQVVTTYFVSPNSYSGEDVMEVSCHCNTLIINKIIEKCIQQGARIAEPGEFTFRAFMNGKLDLSQAEAVAEIINARSRQSLSQSIRHLEGRLSERIHGIKDDILSNLALLEINLDFSDEEIDVMPLQEMLEKLESVSAQITSLLRTYDYGRLLQEGIKLIILGKPNVGKSSLLNSLLERDRAIVSEIPGTTRDYIEANLEIGGLAVQAVDTAGIRQTEDTVEAIGVERALEQIQTADIALCVFEGHTEIDSDDQVLIDIIDRHRNDVNFVTVLNKMDLNICQETERLLQDYGVPTARISAKDGDGIPALKELITTSLLADEGMESEEIVVTSARHKAALEKTITALHNAAEAIKLSATEEIIAVDIRLALDHLGKITGETTSEDVINHIFANFCIGK